MLNVSTVVKDLTSVCNWDAIKNIAVCLKQFWYEHLLHVCWTKAEWALTIFTTLKTVNGELSDYRFSCGEESNLRPVHSLFLHTPLRFVFCLLFWSPHCNILVLCFWLVMSDTPVVHVTPPPMAWGGVSCTHLALIRGDHVLSHACQLRWCS